MSSAEKYISKSDGKIAPVTTVAVKSNGANGDANVGLDPLDEKHRQQQGNVAWLVLEGLGIGLAAGALGFSLYKSSDSGLGWSDGNWKFGLFGFCGGIILAVILEANRRRNFGALRMKFRQGCGLCNGRVVFVTLFMIFGGVTFIIDAISKKEEECVMALCPEYWEDIAECESTTWTKHCAGKSQSTKWQAALDSTCKDLGKSACGGDDDCKWESGVCAKPVIDPDQNGIRHITRITGTLTGLTFVATLLVKWDTVRYHFAHSVMAHALMYMSVGGYLLFSVSRWLVPVPKLVMGNGFKWTWHQYQPLNKIFKMSVNITLLAEVFMVIMGGIVVAAYADLSRASLFSEGGGPGVAIAIYVVFANIIGVTPLAPGSVIDVMGGFLFTLIFMGYYKWNFPLSWVVAFSIVLVLHFVSSCLQYFIGKTRAAQRWLNRVGPPEMLAAFETVLKEASCVKVGIVGQVFMDTMGGLNQGRMNMAFCTQFWSEYASIPNAFALVTLGSILAFPTLSPSVQGQWSILSDMLPLVVMIGAVWQMVGSSYGAKILITSSSDIEEYWMVEEKWHAVQWFMRQGVFPTAEAWAEDIYQFGIGKNTPVEDALWTRCYPVIKESKEAYEAAEVKMEQDPENADPTAILVANKRAGILLDTIREEHYQRMLALLVEDGKETAVAKDKLIIKEAETSSENFFEYMGAIDNDPREDLERKFSLNKWTIGHFVFCIVYFGLFWSTLYNLIWVEEVGLEVAVEKGLQALPGLSGEGGAPIGWASFILFWFATFFYFHREMLGNFSSCGNICKNCFSGKREVTDGDKGKRMETTFDIPQAEMREWFAANKDRLNELCNQKAENNQPEDLA